MYDRKIKELTTEETKLVARAIGIVMTEEFSTKAELVVLRKILKTLVKTRKAEGANQYNLREVRADIQLVERRP